MKTCLWLTAALVVCVGLAALYHLDPARVPVYPVCAFHQLTGYDCPGCGGLRAMHRLLHGDIAAAFRLNGFLVLSLPVYAVVGVWLWWRKRRAMQTPSPVTGWLWAYTAAWMIFGILRNFCLPLTGR